VTEVVVGSKVEGCIDDVKVVVRVVGIVNVETVTVVLVELNCVVSFAVVLDEDTTLVLVKVTVVGINWVVLLVGCGVVGARVIVVSGTFVLSVAVVEAVDVKVEIDGSRVEDCKDVFKVVLLVNVVVGGANIVVGLGLTKLVVVESLTVVGRTSVVVVDN